MSQADARQFATQTALIGLLHILAKTGVIDPNLFSESISGTQEQMRTKAEDQTITREMRTLFRQIADELQIFVGLETKSGSPSPLRIVVDNDKDEDQ